MQIEKLVLPLPQQTNERQNLRLSVLTTILDNKDRIALDVKLMELVAAPCVQEDMESGNIIAKTVIQMNMRQIENLLWNDMQRKGKRDLSIVLNIILENQNSFALTAKRPNQVEAPYVLEDTESEKNIAKNVIQWNMQQIHSGVKKNTNYENEECSCMRCQTNNIFRAIQILV